MKIYFANEGLISYRELASTAGYLVFTYCIFAISWYSEFGQKDHNHRKLLPPNNQN